MSPGCSGKEQVRIEYVPAEVPAPLTQPVPEPGLERLETNADLVNALLDYRGALRICNGALDAIRQGYGGGGTTERSAMEGAE